MDSVLLDISYALRRLLKTPGFALLAVLTLALAIGANTTVFSMLNALVLRPLPVKQPDRLVCLSGPQMLSQSFPNYRDFRDRTKTMLGLVATRLTVIALSHTGENARVWGYEVTGNYFQVLGVKPALGRFFTPAQDTKVNAEPYVVLSYSAWRHRFGGDPGLINKAVKINGLDYTVLGVAPRGFVGTELLFAPEFWVPMSMEPLIEPGNNWLEDRSTWDANVFGRIKTGVSYAQAQSEMQTIAAELVREHPNENNGMTVHFARLGLYGDFFRRPVTMLAAVFMAVAGLVLLIACTNLASSLLARATDRRRETAICLALGAGRLRVVRQFLTEALLLSVVGGTAGLLLASWLTALVAAAPLPFDFPLNKTLTIDGRVELFSLFASLATVLFFGLVPSLQATRPDVLPALKNEARSHRFRGWELRDVFVTGQIALSILLLVGSVLSIRSLQNALTVNVGFNPSNAASVSFDLGDQGYTDAQGAQFQRRVLERVQSLPGIESASLSNTIPLSLDVSRTHLYAYGKPIPKRSDSLSAIFYFAGPDFFHTLQTRILEGRDFTWRDSPQSPNVIVINQAAANRLFPNDDALGKRVGQDNNGPWYQIVGIVENGKYESLNDENQPTIFWPLLQRYESNTTVVVRSRMPANEVINTLRRLIHQMDSTMPLYDVASLEQHLALPLTPARLAASILGGFGFLAVVLAAIGVYGAVAYAVARRTREIGIRVAIGATRNAVLALMMRRTAIILAVGTLLGSAASLALGRFATAILYGVNPHDPGIYLVAIVLMAAIAMIACLFPARRALAVDPASALRNE